MDCVVAIDVGGTRIKAGLLTRDGEALRTETHPTGVEQGPDMALGRVAEVASGLARRARADGLAAERVGVAVPGVVDEAAGWVVSAPNVGWRDVGVRDRLRDLAGLPVTLTHDVRAGAVAEGRLGAARGSRMFLFAAVGTGLGGAAVIDGRPLLGTRFAAAEIGHLRVPAGRGACRCGARDCAETVASAGAIARRYTSETGRATTSAEDVVRAVRAGEERARAIWSDAVDGLADALLAAVTVLDPELVVVGGGLAAAGPTLFDPLRERVAARTTLREPVPVVAARLGDRAGCLGAGLLAWDDVEAEGAAPR